MALVCSCCWYSYYMCWDLGLITKCHQKNALVGEANTMVSGSRNLGFYVFWFCLSSNILLYLFKLKSYFGDVGWL